jgi:predicted peptidase
MVSHLSGNQNGNTVATGWQHFQATSQRLATHRLKLLVFLIWTFYLQTVKFRILPAIVFCLFGLIASLDAQSNSVSPQQIKHFEQDIKVTVKYEYLLFLPKGYDQGKQSWPLMLFLHGAGDAGTNMNRVKILGPPKIVETKPDFPFILISPQSPVRSWNLDALNALLDDVIQRYRVDKDRVYLTGASMGGSATWAFACAHPEKFAAIAPVCGSGNPAEASKVASLPIWVFHGAKDPVVKIERARAMVDAVQAAGGNVKFTVYPEAGHDAWTQAYNDPELYHWLLQQKRHD